MIKKILPSGFTTTLAGQLVPGLVDVIGTNAQFRNPTALSMDNQGNILVFDYSLKHSQEGSVSTYLGRSNGFDAGLVDALGSLARLNGPVSICIDPHNNLYIVEQFEKYRSQLT
jgi:hypothetical protein